MHFAGKIYSRLTSVVPFEFVDPGPLRDAELQLITPTHDRIEDVLEACRHPLTVRLDTHQSKTDRRQLLDFLALAPNGQQSADTAMGRVPGYHFWMWLHDDATKTPSRPPVRIAGGINLRVGDTPDILRYSGHIGYHVYPPARGNHYAERAARLLLPLARRHGLRELWVTTNPDNFASRRTCERLGAVLVDVVPIPRSHPFYSRGEREKCRYRLLL